MKKKRQTTVLGGFVKKIIWKRRLARAGDRGTDLGIWGL